MACERFKRVFVTSINFSGNLNGTLGADAKCGAVAQASNTGGSWTAWLSTSTVDAISRISSNGPWYGTKKNLVLANREGLRSESLSAIAFDETGFETTAAFACTGTGRSGMTTLNTCAIWSTTAAAGTAGNTSAVGPGWSDSVVRSCSELHPLYCFEN